MGKKILEETVGSLYIPKNLALILNVVYVQRVIACLFPTMLLSMV